MNVFFFQQLYNIGGRRVLQSDVNLKLYLKYGLKVVGEYESVTRNVVADYRWVVPRDYSRSQVTAMNKRTRHKFRIFCK